MSVWLVLRLRPIPRGVVDALLDRLFLLTIAGEAELAQFGQQLRGSASTEVAAGDPLVLVAAFRSAAAAERFVGGDAALLAAAIEEPLFFAPLRHGTSDVLPPVFA